MIGREEMGELLWFQAVAEDLNFTRAAARLGTSQPTLSHRIRRLEERLGLRLLSRTTRSVALTEAGEAVLRALAPRMAELEGELAKLTAGTDRLAGTVRITLSDHALDSLVWPKLRPFATAHPGIRLEFSTDNGFRDIVRDRFDAGVRLGESVEADMVAVRIGPDWRLIVVAAPDYLDGSAPPIHPGQLIGVNCITQRQIRGGGLYAWEFAKDGRELTVRVQGQLTFTDTHAQLDAARAGLGVAFMPEDVAAPDIAVGRLVQLLDDWTPLFPGYHLYYPSRQHPSPAFTAVMEALRE